MAEAMNDADGPFQGRSLRPKRSASSDIPQPWLPSKKRQSATVEGRWTEAEHNAFIAGLKAYGKQWLRISQDFVPTRTPIQVRSHAQKFLLQCERQGTETSAYGGSDDGDDEEVGEGGAEEQESGAGASSSTDDTFGPALPALSRDGSHGSQSRVSGHDTVDLPEAVGHEPVEPGKERDGEGSAPDSVDDTEEPAGSLGRSNGRRPANPASLVSAHRPVSLAASAKLEIAHMRGVLASRGWDRPRDSNAGAGVGATTVDTTKERALSTSSAVPPSPVRAKRARAADKGRDKDEDGGRAAAKVAKAGLQDEAGASEGAASSIAHAQGPAAFGGFPVGSVSVNCHPDGRPQLFSMPDGTIAVMLKRPDGTIGYADASILPSLGMGGVQPSMQQAMHMYGQAGMAAQPMGMSVTMAQPENFGLTVGPDGSHVLLCNGQPFCALPVERQSPEQRALSAEGPQALIQPGRYAIVSMADGGLVLTYKGAMCVQLRAPMPTPMGYGSAPVPSFLAPPPYGYGSLYDASSGAVARMGPGPAGMAAAMGGPSVMRSGEPMLYLPSHANGAMLAPVHAPVPGWRGGEPAPMQAVHYSGGAASGAAVSMVVQEAATATAGVSAAGAAGHDLSAAHARASQAARMPLVPDARTAQPMPAAMHDYGSSGYMWGVDQYGRPVAQAMGHAYPGYAVHPGQQVQAGAYGAAYVYPGQVQAHGQGQYYAAMAAGQPSLVAHAGGHMQAHMPGAAQPDNSHMANTAGADGQGQGPLPAEAEAERGQSQATGISSSRSDTTSAARDIHELLAALGTAAPSPARQAASGQVQGQGQGEAEAEAPASQ